MIRFNGRIQYFLGLVNRHFQDSVGGTILGKALVYLQPTLIIFFLSFLLLRGFRGTYTSTDVFAITLALSNWLFFSASINAALSAFRTYRYALYNRDFPRFLLPLVPVFANLLILLVNTLICVAIYIFSGVQVGGNLWMILLAVVANILVCSSIAVVGGYVSVFLNDFRFVVGSVLQVFFWMSPIVWSSFDLNWHARLILELNPFFAVAETLKGAVENVRPSKASLMAIVAHTMVWGAVAWFTHGKLKRVLGEQL